MALELATGARETSTVSGNDFTLTGATSGAITFNAAITKTALTVDGSTVYCYAFENDDPSTYEVMEMTYTVSSNKLTRVNTEHGSNGASAVTFTTDASGVTIFRVLTEADLLPQGVKIYQKGVDEITTGLVSAASSTTTTPDNSIAAACNTYSITPKSNSATLKIKWSAYCLAERDGTSGTTAVGTVQPRYVNGASSKVLVANSKNVGFRNMTATTTGGAFNVASGYFELTQSNLNASGNWEFDLSYYVNNAAVDFTLSNFEFEYEEYV